MSHDAPRSAAVAALATVLLAFPLGVSPATAAPTAPGESGRSLVIKDFAFSQKSVRVTVGDTVTWLNTGRTAHVAKARKAPVTFASPTLAAGESWSYTFTKPGTYAYVCTLHPTMKATVVALPAPGAEASVARMNATTRAAAKRAAAKKAAAARAAAMQTPVVQAAASEPLKSENSAPLLAGSALFVLVLALVARARRPAE
jgi:plastocyanin